MKDDRGFTLVELLVSTAVTVSVTAALFAVVNPTRGVFTTETEASDMQQRLRVTTTVLLKEFAMAGAGTDFGAGAGPLTDFFAAIVPYRQARGGDPPGSFKEDAVTLMYVPSAKAQTTIANALHAQSGVVDVNIGAGCPLSDAACGFTQATTAIVYDAHGSFDIFKIADVQGSRLHLQHTIDDSSTVYPAGSRIVQAVVSSYYLKEDARTDSSQLVHEDGDGGPVVPVVDHVVKLAFEYFADPLPPQMRKPLSDPTGPWTPWTTYGPAPPAADEQPTAYPPGENCVFRINETSLPEPRLSTLHTEPPGALVRLTAAELTDGPWCPDALASNRFDADLLRVRQIAVTVGVESAIDALRGPAGALFARHGSSAGGNRFLPDQTIRFHVTPRNLNLPR